MLAAQEKKGDVRAVKCEDTSIRYQQEHIWAGRKRRIRVVEVGCDWEFGLPGWQNEVGVDGRSIKRALSSKA